MSGLPRTLPITVIGGGADTPLVDVSAQAADGLRMTGAPAPCLLFVDEVAISEAEIAREMQFHRAARPQQSRADAARALVVRELLRREAARLGLLAEGGTGSDEEALIQQLLESALDDRRPSEEDCRRYFERNRERFRSPDRIRLRHVLLAAPPDDVAGRLQARGRAEALVAELRERPELFADLAARHSQCPSHTEGGELGWLQRGQTTPEFDRQVFRLREGLAGFPVESRWGYHVVEVLAIESGQAQSFEQARGRIADYLELQARQQDVQGYLARLRERYPVRGLDEIEAQAGQA